MADPIEIDPKEAAKLTLLRRLVTTLLVVMIGGFLVLIALLVTRFPQLNGAPTAQAVTFPDTIDLPEGVTAEAFTRGADWVAIVADDEILIFDAETGELRQRITLD